MTMLVHHVFMKTWVYRQYAADGRLLYVGATAYPESREKQHALTTAWYHEIARVELTEYPDGPSGYTAEKEAIRSESPKYNRKHNPANKHIKLPRNSWMLTAAEVSRLVWEAVNSAERAA